MKKSIFFAIICCGLPLAGLWAQASLGDIVKAIQNGDAASLSSYFGSTIELTILENSDTYAKAKAAELVKTFFSTKPPREFVISHQGNSKSSDARYAIGTLQAGGGAFRVFLLMRDEGGRSVVQQLQIETN